MERSSNFELLRIISMFMIVLQHYGENSLYAEHEYYGSYLLFGGGLGVNLFVLISGYFMVESTFRAKKLLRVWFYVASIYLTISGLCWALFSPENLPEWGLGAKICELFPILTGKYWFVSTYVLLMLMTPALNCIIRQLTRDQLLACIASLFMFGSFTYLLPLHNNLPGPLAHFIMLYLIAGHIRLTPAKGKNDAIKWGTISCLIFAFMMACIYFNSNKDYAHAVKINNLIVADKGAIILFLSIALFKTFECIKISHNKFVNACASCTFGVYLIHEHCLIKSKLWQFISEMEHDAKFPNYAIKALISICGIYIICTLLTWIWKNTYERFYRRFLEKRLVCVLEQSVAYIKRIII